MTARVVIADDDADIRGLIRISCVKAGMEIVAEVGDGTSALEAVARDRPDLVILDVSMPKMSGLEVCRHVRERAELDDVRILLLSASVDENAIRLGLAAGASAYLAKPFSPRELVASIVEQVGTQR
ncbi:MAG: histidine kinase [Frondihabitans sp.]|nr:histidine kinase [Frondihabitans sp.]